MVKIETLQSSCLYTADKSIDTIKVADNLFYLYNYRGIHFRLFDNLFELIKFFQNIESKFLEFDNEEDLETHLQTQIK